VFTLLLLLEFGRGAYVNQSRDLAKSVAVAMAVG
jgi:hypothetical protein